MFSYRIFGLGVHSTIQLLPRNLDDCPSDIIIRIGKVREVRTEAVGLHRWIQVTEEGPILVWDRVGTFHIRNGKEILVHPAPGVEEGVIRVFLLGACLSVLLQQRGYTVLHASAVSIGGVGIAFAGEKGTGKSTLAAALTKAGHELLSDDTVVLRNGCGVPEAIPGLPIIKLWPDSIKTIIGSEPEQYPCLIPGMEKREMDVELKFATKPVSLQRIFLIEGGPEPEITLLGPQKALLGLLPHWYGARFGDDLLDSLGRTTHLTQCASVVNEVPVLSLARQRSLKTMPEITRLIEKELEKASTLTETESTLATTKG